MLLVWNGRPNRQIGELIAEIEGDVSGDLLQELAAAASEEEFWEIADRIRSSQRAFDEFDAVADDRASPSSTFHIGFFRGSVQISFGERGFVPLSNLLDYSQQELMTYLSERNRIELPRPTTGWTAADGPLH